MTSSSHAGLGMCVYHLYHYYYYYYYYYHHHHHHHNYVDDDGGSSGDSDDDIIEMAFFSSFFHICIFKVLLLFYYHFFHEFHSHFQSEFRDYPQLLRQAISLARRMQDPLIEFSQLCTSDEEILCLRYHTLQVSIH